MIAIENTSGSPQTITVTASFGGFSHLYLFERPWDFVSISGCLDGDNTTNGCEIAGHPIADGEVLLIVVSGYNSGAYSVDVVTD